MRQLVSSKVNYAINNHIAFEQNVLEFRKAYEDKIEEIKVLKKFAVENITELQATHQDSQQSGNFRSLLLGTYN